LELPAGRERERERERERAGRTRKRGRESREKNKEIFFFTELCSLVLIFVFGKERRWEFGFCLFGVE
jgi:hypothetical protein